MVWKRQDCNNGLTPESVSKSSWLTAYLPVVLILVYESIFLSIILKLIHKIYHLLNKYIIQNNDKFKFKIGFMFGIILYFTLTCK